MGPEEVLLVECLYYLHTLTILGSLLFVSTPDLNACNQLFTNCLSWRQHVDKHPNIRKGGSTAVKDFLFVFFSKAVVVAFRKYS